MIHTMNNLVWHTLNANEHNKVASKLAEYSIPCVCSTERSLLPKHNALLVSDAHKERACTVILRCFGRRSGVDLD
jgi:hypothetical protein